MPPSLWSGNLRLSLVLIPVKLHPAISTEEAVSFRMIHEPSGKAIRYVKGVYEGDEFVEVPDEASMQKQGQTKVRDAVRKRMGKTGSKQPMQRKVARTKPDAWRTVH